MTAATLTAEEVAQIRAGLIGFDALLKQSINNAGSELRLKKKSYKHDIPLARVELLDQYASVKEANEKLARCMIQFRDKADNYSKQLQEVQAQNVKLVDAFERLNEHYRVAFKEKTVAKELNARLIERIREQDAEWKRLMNVIEKN
jgi:hypothetical protein